MDLNQIYPLLPENEKKEIDQVIVRYLGNLAKGIGYSIVQQHSSVPSSSIKKIESPESTPVKKRIRTVSKLFPLKLHGLTIPTVDRLVELYQGVEGPWKGELTRQRFEYCRYTKKLSLEEMFPEPPPQKNRETLIKRIDEDGNQMYRLS